MLDVADYEGARFGDDFLRDKIQPFLGGDPLFLPFSNRWSREKFECIIDLFNLFLNSPEELLSLWLRENFGGLDLGLVQRRPGKGLDISGRPEAEHKDYFHFNFLLRERFFAEMQGKFDSETSKGILPFLNSLQSLYVECRELSWAIYRAIKSVGIPISIPPNHSVKGSASPDLGILRVLRYYPTDAECLAEPHTDASCLTICLYEDAPGLECCVRGVWTPIEYQSGGVVVMPADKLQLVTGGVLAAGELRNDNTRKIISGGVIPAMPHRVLNCFHQEIRHALVFFAHMW